MTPPACASCRFHNDQSGVCGAYNIPAAMARETPLLCGPIARDHHARPSPALEWVESWWLIGVALLVLAVLLFGPAFFTAITTGS